jgi:hypothetical protein
MSSSRLTATGIGFGLLIVLASGAWYAVAAPRPAKAEDAKPSRVKVLLQEKLSILRKNASDATRFSQNGGVTADQVHAANQAVYQVELELCDTNQERVAVLENMLAAAREHEQSVVRAAKAGGVAPTAVMTAQLSRLDAEIALERAKDDSSARKPRAQLLNQSN